MCTHPVLVLLLIFAVVIPGWAEELPARSDILQQYNLTAWTEREGLSTPRVRALAQTPDGYLWIGTTDGLFRFEGSDFEPWSAIGIGHLPSERVASLATDRNGHLWIGFATGTVAKIAGDIATVYEDLSLATGGTINALTTDAEGVVWIGARSGLLRVADGRAVRLGDDVGVPDGPVLNVYADGTHALWFSSNTGIFRRGAGAPSFEPVMPASYFDHRVTVDSTGSAWITDPRRGFQVVNLEEGRNPGVTLGPLPGLGVQVLASNEGAIWVATLGQGLWRIRNPSLRDRIEVLDASDGLLNEVVRCLLEDRERNIWIGTDYGLYRLSLNKLVPLERLGVVRVVHADGKAVWVGTSNGLHRFEDSSRQTYGLRGELPSAFVSALHRDADGALWIATDQGIAVHERGRFRNFPIPGIEQLNRIYSMARDARGHLWLADYNRGLFRASADGITPVDAEPGLDHRGVLSVHRDLEGRMWLSLSDGRTGYIRDTDETLRFTPLEPRARSGMRLNHVVQRRPGELWLITSNGVWYIEGERVTIVSERNGLPTSQLYSAAVDDEGTLWMGTSAGVVRLKPEAFAAVAADPGARITYGFWDAYDGAAGLPVWLGLPGVARDARGRVWFVSANGISIAEPERLRQSTPPPPVIIQSISVGPNRMPLRGDLTLPPRSSPVEIDYAAVMLSSAHKVRFRYKLQDFESEWTDAGTRRQALFTNLPPGNYAFRVMAVAPDGSSSESSATLQFAVAPAFTQTPWFFAGLVVASSFALWQAWRLRLRYVQQQFALVINERIRMSREIHDTLLQSLIGVALQLDVLGSSESASEETRATLTRVRRELEEDIRETRQSIWNLRSHKLEQSDLPSLLREAGRRITAGTMVHFHVTVDGVVRRVRADIEQQILRIAEQAIVNAVRHGAASEVEVALAFEPGRLKLRVRDNGRGFDQTQASADCNLHFGLASMRERAAEIGGRFTLDTQPGRGTAVEAIVDT